LDDETKKGLADRLTNDIWEACKEKNDVKHRGALWRATAYLILCSSCERKLLHAISTSQVELFTEGAVETAVECWQWILTSREDLEFIFIQEMVNAWQITFEKKMGLFAEEQEITSPLAAYDGCKLIPKPINVQPHLIWLQLISEMIDTAKYCNRDKVLFSLLSTFRRDYLERKFVKNKTSEVN
jgi:phosphatidylinositol 4-kinase